MPDAGTITRLLNAAEAHDPRAAEELYRLVQDDLQRIARKRKNVIGVAAGIDASTTGLVDDAFCRLVGRDETIWQPGDRRKFFNYMSKKIHGDLIDLIRREKAEKRGGQFQREELGDDRLGKIPEAQLQMLVDLRAALEKLDLFDPNGATLIRCRHFLGCTFEEAAGLLELSKTETIRTHQHVLLWLRRELKGYDLDV